MAISTAKVEGDNSVEDDRDDGRKVMQPGRLIASWLR